MLQFIILVNSKLKVCKGNFPRQVLNTTKRFKQMLINAVAKLLASTSRAVGCIPTRGKYLKDIQIVSRFSQDLYETIYGYSLALHDVFQ